MTAAHRGRLASALLVALAGIATWGWAPPAAARVATLHSSIEVSTYSWHPLPLKTIARIVEARVLQKLTSGGKLTLLPAGRRPTEADVQAKIIARIIEDAGEFSIFVSLVPKAQSRVGSLAAVATNSLRQKDHKGIQEQMERTADQAAAKVARLLGSRLALLTGPENGAIPAAQTQAIPFDWGSRLGNKPRGSTLSGGALESQLLKAERDAKARLRLADCALGQRVASSRQACVQALIQLKDHPFAQRALLKVLVNVPRTSRAEYSHEARREAFRISTTFRGPALEEAKQAWLQVLAADNSQIFGSRREDYALLDPIADYFVRHPEVPNLDLALGQCSRPSARGGRPTAACLKVLATVPHLRRLALLFPHLTEEPENSDKVSGWLGVLQTTLAGTRSLHPALLKLCRQKIQRSRFERLRTACAEALVRFAPPDAALASFLLDELLGGSLSERDVDKAAQAQPRLCPLLSAALKRARSGAMAAAARQLSPHFLRRCQR